MEIRDLKHLREIYGHSQQDLYARPDLSVFKILQAEKGNIFS
ncbi:unnamed protein product, partial [marine sediment metagenome]